MLQSQRAEHMDYHYRAPRDLRRSDYPPKKVLVVGSCLSYGLAGTINATLFNSAEHILFNNAADLPAKSNDELRQRDFQIVQLPLRSIMREHTYFRLKYDDAQAHQDLFSLCCETMTTLLSAAMTYNKQSGIRTFVTNFLLPQKHPLGSILPKYDLRNPVYFVSELNKALDAQISSYQNAYVLDADEISATYGRRYAQDDAIWHLAHGSLIASFDYDRDQDRIEPPDPIHEYYMLQVGEFYCALWHEAEALHDVLTQTDNIKLVVVDLDNTLWRGVLAELDEIDPGEALEGWPLGFIEALLFLKKRGILLGIISKNYREKIEEIWKKLFGDRIIKMDDFASIKINWRSKLENLAEMLTDVNLLARNTLVIDDNPVERAEISQAYPEIRVLGKDHYYLRRIMLWSPELQVPVITEESTRRTEMVQAQFDRENARKKLI